MNHQYQHQSPVSPFSYGHPQPHHEQAQQQREQQQQQQQQHQSQHQFHDASSDEQSYQIFESTSPHLGSLQSFDGLAQSPPASYSYRDRPRQPSPNLAFNPDPHQAPLGVDQLPCLPVNSQQQFSAFSPHSTSLNHPVPAHPHRLHPPLLSPQPNLQHPLNTPAPQPQPILVPPERHSRPDLLAGSHDFLSAHGLPGHPTQLSPPVQVSPETYVRPPQPASGFADHLVLPHSTISSAFNPSMRYMAADVAVANTVAVDDPLRVATSDLTMSRAKPHSPTELTEDASSPRKRARGANSPADNGDKKRSRGRPRLDTKDETAADRRRTQIRLAQRAYRNRKENAIQTLEKRVADLKDTNEEMSNAFMRLHDFAVSQGLLDRVPEFGRQLRTTTEKFLSLARRSSEDGNKEDDQVKTPDDDDDDDDDTALSTETNPILKGSDTSDTTTHTSPETTTTSISALYSGGGIAPATSAAVDYEVVTHPTLDNASFPFGMSSDPSGAFIVPSPYSSALLHPPTSFAHHENTFGRRLQRISLEQALLLASMPAANPEEFGRVFGFCLLFEPRDKITQRLIEMLSVTTHETMDNWRYPFLNLCGQGSFLPFWQEHDQHLGLNRGPVGNEGTAEPLRPQHSTGYSTGPFTSAVTHAKETGLGLGQRITLSGYEGDFFDADETDMYMRQRGVYIPPNSDYVTVEVDVNSFPSDESLPDWASTDSLGSPISTNLLDHGIVSLNASVGLECEPSPTITPPNGVTTSVSSIDTNTNRVLGSASPIPATTAGDAAWKGISISKLLAPETAIRDYNPSSHSTAPPVTAPYYFSGLNTNFLDSGLLGVLGSQKKSPPSPRRVVTLNVTVFINELVRNAVCLGRSPGFRPKDVNAAFWIAARA